MSQVLNFDIARLIDERRVTAFNIGLVVLSFLVILFDGYDLTAIAFAVPYILKEWGLTGGAALGPVFSASLFGVLFGSPLFGYVGDRFGRKIAIIASCLIFGIFTLAMVKATSLTDLMYMRALAGVGLGGLMPNLIALNGEYAPRRFRATMIILMFCGVTFGGALPGAVAVWLVPSFGWRALFYVGGSFPIVMAVCVALWMPESVKYLALREQTRAKAAKILLRLMPDLSIGPDTKLSIGGEADYKNFSPKLLFSDGLALITPLLWLCFAINLMGYYFLVSWMPTLMTGQKILSLGDAAIATSLIQLGGTLGGLVLCRPMDSRGFAPLAIFAVAAVPCVAAIGFAAISSPMALLVVAFLVGFCLLGLQFGLNAASAMIYPTAFRSSGSGWAFGVGRFGSIVGPIFGGFLIHMQISLQTLFLIAAIPFAVGAVACLLLARLYRQQFRGAGLGQREPVPEMAAAAKS
jgi:AAHS family 4-hydroxybenzoate transporter-like MFS transporter